MSFDPRAVLADSGTKEDTGLDVLTIALAYAACAHEGINMDRYFFHAGKIVRDVESRFDTLIEAGAADDAATRLAAMKYVIADQEGYQGDDETYDDIQNADLVRVIDRRKGMPIALCILYIHAGRKNGWAVDGLNFPGHFLCRIEYKGERIIFDAFAACNVLDAPDLRRLLKQVRGPDAELSADFYKPCTNRETLTRLQNNVKLRLIDAEDYAQALQVVELMRLADPGEYRLLFDAGVLYAKTGQKKMAADVLEKYIERVPNAHDRRDAEMILRQIRDTLN